MCAPRMTPTYKSNDALDFWRWGDECPPMELVWLLSILSWRIGGSIRDQRDDLSLSRHLSVPVIDDLLPLSYLTICLPLRKAVGQCKRRLNYAGALYTIIVVVP